MPMNPRLLRPRSSIHPEAADWANRVRSNGGSVSGTTLSAVSKFCASIASAGIRDRFYRLNLFCGTGLSACLVPLYRGPSLGGTQYGGSADTNVNFVSGDYVETGASGGLLGNGTSKYLNTGFNVDQFPGAANCHLSSYIRGAQNLPTLAANTLIGMLFNGVADRYRMFLLNTGGGSNYGVYSELGVSTQASGTGRLPANGGLLVSSRTSATSLTIYDDAVSIATNTNSVSAVTAAVPIFVFARTGPAEYYNGIMAGYSIGAGLTGAEVTSYYNAINTLQTALGRAQT